MSDRTSSFGGVASDRYGLFSFWDFMREINPFGIAGLFEAYERVQRILKATEQFRVAGSPLPPKITIQVEYSGEELENGAILEFVHALRRISEEAELTNSIRNLKGIEDDLPKSSQHAEFLLMMVSREIMHRRYLRLPIDRTKYFKSDDLISEAVKSAFKEGVPSEIRSAGTAYACALPNACVFHAMRAAEVGLRIIAAKLDVPLTGDEQLQNVIDGIRKAANKLIEGPKVPGKSDRCRFYSEIAIDAGHFKDAWRNYVAHAKADYRDPQALNVLSATCHFFEVIAEQFSEDDSPPLEPKAP